MYATNHFAIDKILKTKPFLKHFINDKIVITKYIISNIEVVLYSASTVSSINYFSKGLINNINEGRRVKTEIIANNIAKPVKIPK